MHDYNRRIVYDKLTVSINLTKESEIIKYSTILDELKDYVAISDLYKIEETNHTKDINSWIKADTINNALPYNLEEFNNIPFHNLGGGDPNIQKISRMERHLVHIMGTNLVLLDNL